MKISILAGILAVSPYLVQAATPVQPLVDGNWIKANGCNAGVVVLDIRSEKIDGQSAGDYRKGHVPCAVHTDYHTAGWRTKVDNVPGMLAPVDKLEALIGALGIDNDTHVVISPRGNSAKSMGAATRVYWTLKVLGHDPVSILDGGTESYAANKTNVLEPGERKPQPKSFRATLRSDMLVGRDEVQRALAERTGLVDYRGPDQFLGINRHAKVKQRGTLPGAANLPIEWLTIDNTGRYRSTRGLEEVYRLAKVPTDEGHIAFCNTGHNSAMGWFVASELLGNKDVRAYDGSMADWTRQDQPVVDRRINVAD
ncbi:MAG: rhodanese-like domain-containing protein [Gammaproteobacteria bacterium]|nr:rhodanese-like domain-containing protein [Gammaproteobacteria bacterium]